MAHLTAGQLRSYQAKLERFTSSGGWAVIPDTGEVVSRRLVTETIKRFREGNRLRAKEVERINRIFVHGAQTLEQAQHVLARKRVFGKDISVEVKEEARTRQAWERRAKRAEQWAKGSTKSAFNRARRDTRFRYKMLVNKAGRVALANKIGNMRNDLFDVLVNRTGFEEVIQLMYENETRGLDASDYEAEAWEIIRAVERGAKVF